MDGRCVFALRMQSKLANAAWWALSMFRRAADPVVSWPSHKPANSSCSLYWSAKDYSATIDARPEVVDGRQPQRVLEESFAEWSSSGQLFVPAERSGRSGSRTRDVEFDTTHLMSSFQLLLPDHNLVVAYTFASIARSHICLLPPPPTTPLSLRPFSHFTTPRRPPMPSSPT